ncbi:MAG: phosphatase PAP2 family protein [Bacteriovoracaceae bacterium]
MQSLREKIISWDQSILIYASNHRSKNVTRFFSIVSYSGTAAIWLSVVLFLCLLEYSGFSFLPQGKIFLQSLTPAGLSWIIGGCIKAIVKRPRPFQSSLQFKPLVPVPGTNDSFPSNHMATSTAFLTCLVLNFHPLSPIVFLWCLSIGFSRIYLNVHYPTDVLAGSILGMMIGTIYYFLNIF